ncbi:GNAT family N-acetyltransferase [Roseateles violae]|uniref:GNAT family N-acetyltransferase n=1 Tax=Roseateles violae TaxID=3058042 RepID=A0ABT8DRN8_9BURK|nr:GNAT family N-acetyltransferase [Pelomonas sp. PFR6]MDN3919738.1 GNAT family N-acetyltransferase [Pelomonas sp. PFR6]
MSTDERLQQPPLNIRRIEPSDAAAMARLVRDPEVFPGLLQVPYASEAMWKQRLQDCGAPGRNDLQLVAERGGELVGNAGLQPVGEALRRRHVMGLGIMVAAHAQRQGIGHALMTALLDFADNWAQVLRIELSVYVDNEHAIALYQRHGFEVEGRMRAYALRAGRYVDTLAMARLHPHPPRLLG